MNTIARPLVVDKTYVELRWYIVTSGRRRDGLEMKEVKVSYYYQYHGRLRTDAVVAVIVSDVVTYNVSISISIKSAV